MLIVYIETRGDAILQIFLPDGRVYYALDDTILHILCKFKY